jgi:hypothetical protein
MLFFEGLKRGLVFEGLMGPGIVVFHFPKPELVFSFFGVLESQAVKNVLVVRPVGALDEAVFPRFALWDEGMGAPVPFNGFGEGRFAVGLAGIFHGEVAGVVGEGDEKGGRRSSAF